MAGEAVLSAFMQVLFEKLTTAALNELRSFRNAIKELENLRSTLSTVQALLEDAEEKQLRDRTVRQWLSKLKEIAYDMDDLIDNYAAEALQSQQEGRGQSYWKLQVSNCFSCYFWNKGLLRCNLARRVKEMRERLDKIARERDVLGLRVLVSTSGRRFGFPERPQSSSLVNDSNVFGRKEDRDCIVELLLSSSESSVANVSVLPIVGMGGIGKTTLTQLVYNDYRVVEHFQLRMWVYVSENFDEMKLTKETLESTAGGYSSATATTTMNTLQENLFEKLRGKRFLLVLDDVWNEDYDKWRRYHTPLISGEKGSKVIVTTQNENVGRVTGGLPPYRLKQLSDGECWFLFRSCAFINGCSDGYPKLEEIGKEIVKKLKGLPLAAKALGSLLYSKVDEDDWKDILRSEIWELPDDKNNILPALRLSYKHLPSHLKQCFAFCSVFHKDYVFEKDKLVRIWVALGFIQPRGRRRMEDIGNGYFDDLLSRSFFQFHKGNYVMHDAIHDLAQSISIDECLRLGDGERCGISEWARHVSFSCHHSKSTWFEAFYGFERLRTLLLLRGYRSNTSPVPHDLFLKLSCLRVLDLYRRDIRELPESIGNLKQLRYLGLSGTQIKKLPSSIGRLYNLQTLNLKDCNSLMELPNSLTNLINLRHLEASTRLTSKIAGIGKLTCLQELEEFIVSDQTGYMIGELKYMMYLRGNLCIRNLDNVVSCNEAREAMLNTKENLSKLELVWSDDRRIDHLQDECLDAGVLEGLSPHSELKELTIKGYISVTFPSWLGSPMLSNLRTLRLLNCNKCSFLPPLGQLPFLRYLEIVGVSGLMRIGREFAGEGYFNGFPSLTELVLEDLQDLEEWLSTDSERLFPVLTSFEIIECPKLRELPRLPPTLAKLRISETGLIALPELWSLDIPMSPALSSLHVADCPNITSLEQSLLKNRLRSLEELIIANCEELVSLPQDCFQSIISLKNVRIYNCPKLVPWAREGALLPCWIEDLRVSSCSSSLINSLLTGIENFAGLAHLEITDCPELSSFPTDELPTALKFLGILNFDDLEVLPSLQHLSCLATLVISNCTRIPALPEEGLPEMLRELYIIGCPALKERCKEDGGEDWPKIAGVAIVEIDGERIEPAIVESGRM